MSAEDNPGYVLRISTEEWLKQVFERGKYYSGVMRKWRRGTPILLAKKAGASDCFVGYGVVDKVEMLWVIIYKSVVNYPYSKGKERTIMEGDSGHSWVIGVPGRTHQPMSP